MKSSHLILLTAGILAASTATLLACIWDTDTLAAERSRLPDIAELISGSFPRHSREFHEWRSDHCKKLIASRAANVSTYDDLAVSMHKLGDHKGAIEIMRAKELLFPGLYETRSNLGTFYIYTGEMDEALKHIRAALLINPSAHFGREKYQQWLVEWLQERRKSGVREPEPSEEFERAEGKPFGFALFVARNESAAAGHPEKVEITLRQLDDAIFGVSGMMRFADFDNPLLLEALGDLLLAGDIRTNAAQLACLSYLHASKKVTDAKEKKRLRALALSGVFANRASFDRDGNGAR
jgi:tetratricopeptide (TPR) repeat protein